MDKIYNDWNDDQSYQSVSKEFETAEYYAKQEATPTPPVDYAWAYTEKMSIPIPEKRSFNPSNNYHSEIQSFAESIGFHMSQSNGIYTLRPTPPRKNLFEDQEQMNEFLRKNPECQNMKGTQARANGTNGTFQNYNGNAGLMKLNNSFRQKRMTIWLTDEVRCSEGTRQILKYLNKNSYRKLQKTTIKKKFGWFDDSVLIQALTELGYLESSFNTKAKLCYQLTVKGREYVNNIKS